MTLTLNIVRGAESTQVSCELSGKPIMEFYGFGLEFSDEEIEESVRVDLAAKGYDFTF